MSPAPDNRGRAFTADDEKLLDRLESAAFRYFIERTDHGTGLVADCTRKGSAASIAATGFGLSCYPIGVERGWTTRAAAVAATRRTLKFLAGSRQGGEPDATGHRGFYYHFLDLHDGKRAHGCELSTIDTAMLLAGMAVARQYFGRRNRAEASLRSLVDELLGRVDWPWTLDGDSREINQAWTPEEGFRRADWRGYTEALVMYVMGAASTDRPLPRAVYEKDVKGYHWRHNAGLDWIHAAPLFIHLFPQAWIDLRGLDDGHVSRGAGLDYFENSRRAIAVQRNYAFLNPHGFAGYGNDVWGLSACMGPTGEHAIMDGRRQQFLGYAARGAPDGPDDGTLVPWAAATCAAHAPDAAMAGVRAILDRYPRALRGGQFVGAINPSLPGATAAGWVAPSRFGIDQGLVTMMIENARTGLVWRLTRDSPVFCRGLRRLGFFGGWLDAAGTGDDG